jgi:hypothetical protein
VICWLISSSPPTLACLSAGEALSLPRLSHRWRRSSLCIARSNRVTLVSLSKTRRPLAKLSPSMKVSVFWDCFVDCWLIEWVIEHSLLFELFCWLNEWLDIVDCWFCSYWNWVIFFSFTTSLFWFGGQFWH